ncbi:MAG: hypothetical protein ACREBV_05150 [Candidatus Zixiibacteriota bacterium]
MRVLFNIVLPALLILPLAALAQTDRYGKADTIYADVEKVNETTWKISISMVNDEFIAGISIPMKLSAGMVKIVGDSAIYRGGRVEHFAFKAFRADTAIQCVTMGMLANMGPTNHTLAPGSGRLFTVFISSFDKKPIEKLKVDTATTQPSNSLMAIADYIQWTDPPDTLPLNERKNAEIIPVFVVREPK